MSSLKLPHLRGNWRLAVWCLLCVLTLLIFLYPAQLHYEYAIIQSLTVFSNLPLFGALYYVWFAMILVLLFLPGSEGKRRDWENVVLLGIFVLVFSGIWVSLSHGDYGECLPYVFRAKGIVETGSYPAFDPDMGPNDFPGLPLLLSSIRLITRLETFDATVLLLLVNMLAYSIMLYVLFRSLLYKPLLAAMGSLILLMGNRQMEIFIPMLQPRSFGINLFIPLVIILLAERSQTKMNKSIPTTIIFIILFSSLTITHFATALVFVIILAAMYLVGKFSKHNQIELSTIVLFLVIIVAWLTYMATYTNTTLVVVAYNSINEFFAGKPISEYLLHITGSYFAAEEMQVWISAIRFFWLALAMGLGAIIGFVKLFKIRGLSLAESKLVGGLVGLGIFVILTILFTRMIEGDRFLYYLPVLSVPIMFDFVNKQKEDIKRYCLVVLAMLILIVSVPTFFVHNDRVGVAAVYPQEESTSKYLMEAYGEGDTLQVVGDGQNNRSVLSDMPHTKYIGWRPPLEGFSSEQEIAALPWKELERLTWHFTDPNAEQNDYGIRYSVFLFSPPRLTTTSSYLFGIDLTKDLRWDQFISRLNQEQLLYTNGFSEVYLAKAIQ